MYNKLLQTYQQTTMAQTEMMMPRWRMLKAKITIQTIIAVAVAAQGLELPVVTYEKRAKRPEKVVLMAGERRYCTQDVLATGFSSHIADQIL